MDQSHSKLETKPMWSAHAELSNPSGEESAASILPSWRDQSLWRITTTKTVERLSGEPKCGVKQHYEAFLKKHAIEYTKLMREYDDMKAKEHEDMKLAGAEKKTEFEQKESEWKEMIEQIIFNLVMEMTGRASGSGQKDGKSAEERQKEEKASAPKEDQGKFIAQLLDFSRNGAKVQETEEQPFPDCKYEEMEDGEAPKKEKVKRKDDQGLNDKEEGEKKEASQVRQQKKSEQKQV